MTFPIHFSFYAFFLGCSGLCEQKVSTKHKLLYLLQFPTMKNNFASKQSICSVVILDPYERNDKRSWKFLVNGIVNEYYIYFEFISKLQLRKALVIIILFGKKYIRNTQFYISILIFQLSYINLHNENFIGYYWYWSTFQCDIY